MISSAKILTVSGLKSFGVHDSQNQLFACLIAWIETHVTLLVALEIWTLLGYFYEPFPFSRKLWWKTVVFTYNANGQMQCLKLSLPTFDVWYDQANYWCISNVVQSHRFANKEQQLLQIHVSSFFMCNICNT